MEAELICSICHDYFLEATTISCSHTFCKICITDWQKQSRVCPICRQPIKHLIKSQALNALANLARERYEKEAFKSFDKSKAKNVSKATNTTAPFEAPSTSASGSASRLSRSPLKVKDLVNASKINNDNGKMLDLATFGSNLAGIAVDVVNKKLAEKIPVVGPLTNFLATLGRTKVLGGEMKSLLQSAVHKTTGRTIPDDVLDAILIGYSDAGGNYTADMATKLIANIIDQQYANFKNNRHYCNDSSDSDDDDAYRNDFKINIKYID
ncbi:E3 ubiquitin-protein ligase rnf8-A-like [Agrilus planipennis]|uniref:E3 ubiquitin-protein ligase rnf8-A-like n=1 Tax=Agrilus planipennis TaxID=224129 RepID=A0A1W4X9B0_AGRPL|nr:E3 ubiquitin-protein ligase rnf8-A-like [Agrilus planipennis]